MQKNTWPQEEMREDGYFVVDKNTKVYQSWLNNKEFLQIAKNLKLCACLNIFDLLYYTTNNKKGKKKRRKENSGVIPLLLSIFSFSLI